jgi:phosphoribosylanthranilate isomerase
MTKVKICDIRTIEDALLCEKVGVDFIGIHQIEAPLSDSKKELIITINALNPKYKLVLVTKESRFNFLWEMLSFIHWDFVQLHFPSTLDLITKIKYRLKNDGLDTGIITVMEGQNFSEDMVRKRMEYCEHILFDTSFCGGTGKTLPREVLQAIKQKCNSLSYFIAGGLNPQNIAETIKLAQPFSVDVQSGVESTEIRHKKDENKLISFMRTVRQANE